jgi:uncharacterized iron-regulated protein
MTRALAWLALLASLAGCGAAPPAAWWRSSVARDHPLVGRIRDVAGQRFIDEATLVGRLARARYVLLGERHDNPDHHALQARVVRALAAVGRRPAVAFEMLAPSQADALARHLAARPRDAAGLGRAVSWETSGWPPWPMYAPVAQAALDAGLPIVVANLDPERARAVGREGVAALDPALVARHGLDRPLPDAPGDALAAEIRDAHCGHAPADRLAGMVAAQRARDAQMAEALLNAPGGDGALLIAGAGHVRKDFGVPFYLERIERARPTVSVAFLEVDPGRPRAEPDAGLPFDYVWFTPAVDAGDPCEALRGSLERLRR